MPRLTDRARSRISDEHAVFDAVGLAYGSLLGPDSEALSDRSVLVATRKQIASAAAMFEVDGVVRRLVIAPPDLRPEHLAAVLEDAEVDTVITDEPARSAEFGGRPVLPLHTAQAPVPFEQPRPLDTEWILLTSGTSGRPKMVVHTLSGLTGAIRADEPASASRTVWATFYDIRRYGGLQIFLRAALGGADLILSGDGEPLGDHLHRLGANGVTHISGTPSHWRRVLMSGERAAIDPRYIRLSGEIADQMVLDGLRAAFPRAAIGHAYASTEAGVGFAVEDGREGFPIAVVETSGGDVELRVVDGTLRIRSKRTASRYLGRDAAPLADADGFVDTGDLVELRGDRFVFVGRRGGIINVGGLKVNPEEVEAAINSHAGVRMSLVKARKNPLTGAIVTADIVLREALVGDDNLKTEILDLCRSRLERHKVPAIVRFVPSLALTPGGKLSRVPVAPNA